jgi:hypothetical protein
LELRAGLSQAIPVQPVRHEQYQPPASSTQLALFWQGELAHAFASASQAAPDQAGAQRQM